MLADELIAVHENARTVAPFTDRQPGPTPDEAYSAAQALHRSRLQRGWKPIGRKIGFTNRTIWPRYGVYEPIWGTVYDRTLVASGNSSATIPLHGLVQPRIEPEICFGLKSSPLPGSKENELLKSIEWVAHSIEIVQCHHPEWKLKLADACADNGLHGRLVIGPKIPVTSDLIHALPKLEVVLKKDGQAIDRGV